MSILSDIPFIGKLIDDYGEKLVVTGIEKLTGVDLSKKELTDEDKQKVLDNEFRILELDFNQFKEINRHEEAKYTKAHDTYVAKNDMADVIAKQIISRNLPLIGVLVTINIAVVYFLQENASLIAIASNIIGISIGNLFSERQAIVNFFFGSSIGSKDKTEKLNQNRMN